jgi:hypothetical protein
MKKSTFEQMRSRLFLSILISVITFAGFGCNKNNGDHGYSISGTVIDSLTKAPIDSAWVIVHDTTAFAPTYTDSLGHYYWGSDAGGWSKSWLYVGKPGYRTKSRYFAEVRTDIRGIDFELVRDTL